jgi:Gas vesicle protein G
MGLFGILLTFPVSGPVLTAKAAIKTIINEAERQLYDQAAIQEELAMVDRAYRAGELTEAEFAGREEALLERLIEARRWHLEKAREGEAP